MPEIRANNVPEEIVRRFDIERAKRGRMSIREAVIEAIELWIETGDQKPTSGDEARLHQHEHELLDLLLLSDPEFADKIRGVLETFAIAVSASKGRAKKQTKAG